MSLQLVATRFSMQRMSANETVVKSQWIGLIASVLMVCWPAITLARVVITDTPGAAAATEGHQFSPDAIPSATQPSKLKAASPKRVSAQIQLGLQKLHGLNEPQDLKQAGYVFMLAFSRGDPQASTAVAYCTLMGCYGVPDRRSLALWIDRARQREPAKAKLLEWASAEQSNEAQMRLRAVGFLRDAVALQDPVALNEQGLQQLTSGQRNSALRSFETAAQRGSAAGARNFNLLVQQINEKTNPFSPQVSSIDARSAKDIPGQSLYEQAIRYHAGKDTPVNDVQAIELYRQAANLGHLQAKRMLELILVKLDARGNPDPLWMRLLAQRHLASTSLEVPSSAIWLQKDNSLLADWIAQE
jgi:TPR repeat protein